MRVDRVKYRLICAAAGAALLALAGCDKQAAAPAAKPPTQVGVVTVEPRTVAVDATLPGRATSYLVAEVRARADGIVIKRDFKQGSEVKIGQVLYQIDPAPYQASLASAQATLAKAQATVKSLQAQAERYKALVAQNAVSKQDYDNAVSSLGSAVADVAAGRAAVQTAQINLGYTTVRSPITGRIGTATVTVGAYVQASAATLMATVQQISPLYVDLSQSTNDLLALRQSVQSGKLQGVSEGSVKVHLLLDNGSELPDVGTLEFTDITVDQSTGTTTVRAVFPNKERDLLPGMFVRARIQQASNDKAILVPMQGITHDQKGEPTALVVGADNKVVNRNLTTTQALGAYWVVTSGLNAGDKVVVSGLQSIAPGATVNPVAATLPPPEDVSADTSGSSGGADGAATEAASAPAMTSAPSAPASSSASASGAPAASAAAASSAQ